MCYREQKHKPVAGYSNKLLKLISGSIKEQAAAFGGRSILLLNPHALDSRLHTSIRNDGIRGIQKESSREGFWAWYSMLGKSSTGCLKKEVVFLKQL
jgi:hypothetical protein